ncbi:MAG: tetratricopeptide repeat protein [Chromatiales bacterium]|nr:tetratricopeptide repeat protein [Chromatiales bacterium]
MHKILITILTLFLFACAGTPELPPSSSLANVDFISDVPMGKGVKLLHWSENRFYVAQEDGSVEVLDKNGRKLATLPSKNSRGERILEQPEAIALFKETIYVVDSETELVAMFSRNGELKGTFGGRGGDMQLNNPHGIAIYDGIVYVADSGNSRIQLYGINGVFLTVLDINENKHNQKVAEKSKIPFQLDEPIDIELDALGRIYVLDKDDSLVKIYSQSGQYINKLPNSGEPIAINISESGIFVANIASYTINKYNFDFRLDSTFGSKGKGRAQFMSMSGLAIDGKKKVFVGDSKANSIHLFSTETGEPLQQWQRQATPTSIEWLGETKTKITKFAWNGKETIFAINPDKHSILKIENGTVTNEIKIKGLDPVAIAIYPDSSMLLIDREKKRVVKLSNSGEIISSFGTSGSGAGMFDEPVDIAISSAGLIFVADRGNSWIQVFNSEGIFLNVIRDTINPEIKLQDPSAIALDPMDNLYVLDRGNSTISIFSAKGEPKSNFAKSKKSDAPGNFSNPTDLIATHNEVLLLDQNQVKVYNKTGGFLRSWGVTGKGIGQFNQPTSISAKDSFTFAIADSGNKRIQRFTTLHKPPAIQNLTTKGGMHAVEVRWSPVKLPYFDHYQLYRAESKSGLFMPIGRTEKTQYIDKGLKADHDYYYRVSTVTNRGYESTLKKVASSSTRKYIPHEVENLIAHPSAWQVKLRWNPLEESYSSSYLIYKKSGEGFSKIGESSLPEFIVGSLDPENDYTFYVTAISSDGIESKKVAATATTLVATTTPLEIDILEMKDVFSNTYKIYEQDSIGRIKLTNNTGDIMQNIKVGFTLKDFMDFPTGSQIDQLAPGDSLELTLKAVFNNNILNVTEDTPVQTELTASYFENGEKKSFSKNHTINVYEKHRLSWDDRDRFASFITPKDPLLINYVRSVATQFKETKIKAQWAAAVFNSLGVLGLTYIQDPTNPYQVTSGKTDFVDYIQYPRETLERKSGDCDDLVALYTASLESLGVETRVIEVPGHMLMMFNTGIRADSDGYTMDDMYVIHEGMLWIPIETTVVGNSFLKAWELGSQNYYQWKGKGLSLLNIQDSWRTYKPASLPQSTWSPSAISRASIEKSFPGEYMSILKIGTQTKVRRYQQTIKENPNDLDALLQMGIIFAKAGDRKEAMKYFDKIIKVEPNNAAALNNRGNLLVIDEKLKAATESYLAATESDAADPHLWINLAKTYKALKQIGKAKAAFIKATKLDPSIKKKHRVMALELLNTL